MVEFEFKRPTDDDLRYIAKHMRKDDVIEIMASGSKGPYQSLVRGVKESKTTVVASYQGVPMVIYGMSKVNPTTGTASIWMLGTDHVTAYPRQIMVYTRRVLREMLKEARMLTNYTHARHITSVNWSKALGCKLEEPVKRGPYKELFHRFTLERDDV